VTAVQLLTTVAGALLLQLLSGFALLPIAAWAVEPPPKVNLVGSPALNIDSLPEGPYRTLVMHAR